MRAGGTVFAGLLGARMAVLEFDWKAIGEAQAAMERGL